MMRRVPCLQECQGHWQEIDNIMLVGETMAGERQSGVRYMGRHACLPALVLSCVYALRWELLFVCAGQHP